MKKEILKIGLTMVSVFLLGAIFFPRISEHIREEEKRTAFKAKAEMLNHYLPSFDALAKFAAKAEAVSEGQWQAYRDYYKKVVEFFPQMSDAHALLGISYYYLGSKDQAVTALKEAVMLEPNFFWHSYNLGVIYFKDHHYLEAVKFFKKALKTKPEEMIKSIVTSKIYQQILAGMPTRDYPLARLSQGYLNSSLLLAISFKALEREDLALEWLMKVKAYQEHRELTIPSLDQITLLIF